MLSRLSEKHYIAFGAEHNVKREMVRCIPINLLRRSVRNIFINNGPLGYEIYRLHVK